MGHSLDELDTLRDEFDPLVERALTLAVTQVAENLTTHALTAGAEEDAFAVAHAWETQVDHTLVPHIAAVFDGASLSVAYQLAGGLDLDAGDGIPMVPPDPAVAYLSQARNRLTGVGDDVWQHVRDQLVAGVQAGESVEQLAVRIAAAGQLSLPRARTVARTEVNAASNAGAYSQLAYLGLAGTQEWLATSDLRTREDHALANGQTVPLDGVFTVGGWPLRWPGDPTAPASETVNCRCTVAFDLTNDPPAITCDALAVTAAASHLGQGAVPKKKPTVVSTSNCVVPPSSVPAHANAAKIDDLTDAERLYVYQTFQYPKAISPAYGGAKIHKQVQATLDALKKTGKPHLQTLGPQDIVHIVDEHYTGGKYTFKQKYDEWLGSKSGVATTPHQAVTSEPKSITAKELLDQTKDVTATPVGHVYAVSVNTSGLTEWRIIHTKVNETEFVAIERRTSSSDEWLLFGKITASDMKYLDKIGIKWHVPGETVTVTDAVPGVAAVKKQAGQNVSENVSEVISPTESITTNVTLPGPVTVTPVATPTVGLTHLPPVPELPNLSELKYTGKTLGSHGAQVWVDAQDQRWLFKPQTKMLTAVDRATAILQSKALQNRPGVYDVKLDGKSGSLQSMFKSKDAFPGGFDPLKLTTEEIVQLQSDHIFDWLIGNHDAHSNQFVRLDNGDVVAVDKGQAFKFFATDKLDWKWKAPGNVGTPVYDQMWSAFAAGKDVKLFDPTTGALGEFIKHLQSISDAEYKSILRPYAQAAKVAGKLAYGDVETFLDAAIARKKNLAKDFGDLYQRALTERTKVTGVSAPTGAPTVSTPTPKPKPVAPAVNPTATVDPEAPGPVKTNKGYVPLVQQAGDISAVPELDQEAFYQAFKKQKVTAVWSGNKIWEALQQAKAQGFAFNDLEALKILDKKFAQHGGSTGFVDKITKWEQSTAGKKVLGEVPAGVTVTPALAMHETATHVGVAPSEPIKFKNVAEIKSYGKTQPVGKPFAHGTTPGDVSYRVTFTENGKLLVEVELPWKKGHWKTLAPTDVDAILASPTVKWQSIVPAVAMPGPKPTAPVVDISTVPSTLKHAMLKQFTAAGPMLSKPPATIYKKVVEIREYANAQGHALSDLDVLRILDAEKAAQVGLNNAFLYEKKVVEWLKTAAGKTATKKYAAGVPTPTTTTTTPTSTPVHAVTPSTSELNTEVTQTLADVRTRISTTDKTFSYISVKDAFSLQKEIDSAHGAWTVTERAGLRHYTGGNYRPMNNYLRGKSSSIESVDLKAVRNAQKGMRPSTRPILVHRGTGFSQFGGTHVDSSIVGKVFRDEGFMSTSVGGSAAFGGAVLLEIECPTGTPMAFVEGITKHPGENEMLLAAGTTYRVVSVTQASNTYGGSFTKVRVRVIPS